MLVFVDYPTGYLALSILNYKLNALEKFNQCMALGEKESGNQVKQVRND
jgi:hypothetical protein